MNKKQIEEAGIAALTSYFSRCEHIESFIDHNDKTPLWDGKLCLYKNSSHTTENYIGDVKVQVKSHNKFSDKQTVKHPVKVVDLNTYNRNGGLVYLVPYIEDESNPKLYYCLLTQTLLKKYIKLAAGKASSNITLSLLPENREVFENQLIAFFHDCSRQTTSYDKEIVQMSDFMKLPGVHKFNVTAHSFKPITDIQEYLRNNEVYLYAVDDDNNIKYAIGDGPCKLLIGGNGVKDFCAGEYRFNSPYTVIEDSDKYILTIGNRFVVTEISKIGKQCQTQYTMKPCLSRQKLREVEFLLAAHHAQEFSVEKLHFRFNNPLLSEETLEEYERNAQILREFHELLDTLHIKKDLDFESITEEQRNTLYALYHTIVKKEQIELEKPLNRIQNICISGINILILCENVEEKFYTIQDFFNASEPYSVGRSDDERYSVSPISLLSYVDMSIVDNIDYGKIIPTYIALSKDNPEIYKIANNDLLKLLLAYDKTEGKNKDLLDAATAIAQWLVDNEQITENFTNKLNLYQCLKRLRTLTEEEIDDLCSIAEECKTEDGKAAALLLSDNLNAAQRHYNKLKKEAKELFDSLPISHFMNKKYITIWKS